LEGSSGLHLVFVYGTLLGNGGNHRILATGEPLGPASTPPHYHLVDMGGYPAMVVGGETAIQGAVYRVDDRTLALIDDLEGHPDYYQRQHVRLRDGRRALAYLLPPARARLRPVIESGDWQSHDPVRGNDGDAI